MSLMVLITSFIPVFGVFLSTVPMSLIALSEYGMRRMIDVILMVIGIHVVEVSKCLVCSSLVGVLTTTDDNDTEPPLCLPAFPNLHLNHRLIV